MEIRADKFIYWYSRMTGTQGTAKAFALYPFIFTTSNLDILPKDIRNVFINHERIHLAQQKELLIIGMFLFNFIERLYYFLIQRKSLFDSYLLTSFEQEAYDNMFTLDYLSKRKPYFGIRNYLQHKPVLTIPEY